MFRTKDEYREHLEELSYEELLGEEFLEKEAEAEMTAWKRSDLSSMGYKDLLKEEYLERLPVEEIERRLEAFEEDAQ